MEVRPFRPSDFLEIQLQPMQARVTFTGQTLEHAQGLAQSDESFTAVAGSEVIACIGVIRYWEGRRFIWGYLAESAGRCLRPLTREVKRWLTERGQGRIETAIDPQFANSVQWARLLGFEREGTMREWIPGKDFDLYARIGR